MGATRDAEPEPEPESPEPTHFGRSRSRRNVLLGAVKNRAAPALKTDKVWKKYYCGELNFTREITIRQSSRFSANIYHQ